MQFKQKSKLGISMMIAFIMLFQIIGPLAYAYADSGLGFKILSVDIEGDEAIVNWRIVLDANYEVEEYTYSGNFTVEEEKTGQIIAKDGTVIGGYTVSTEGLITVTTDKGLKNVMEEEVPAVPKEPITPEIPEEENSEEASPKEIDNSSGEATNTLENVEMKVALLSSAEEPKLEIKKAPKTLSFEDSFVIEGVKEKPAFDLLDMVVPFGGGIPEPIDPNRVSMKDFKLIINGEDIIGLTEAKRADLEVEQSQTAQFTVTFNLNLDGISQLYKAGDYFEFEFPTAVKDYGNFSGISVPDKDDINAPVFNYAPVSGGIQKIRVSLANDMDPTQASNDIKVRMNFYSAFKLSGEELEQDIIIPKLGGAGGTDTIGLTFKPTTKDNTMTKESLGFTRKNGERYIDWVIWVNEAGKNLDGATITDTPSTFPEHEIVSNSVSVSKYEIGLNGVIDRAGSGESVFTDVNFTDVRLSGKFAYKITYRTKVINPSKPYSGQQTFRNTAILESPGYTTETHHGAQSIAYGDALAKRKVGTGSNYESSWEIEYNYNLASIPVPILGDFHIVDTFPGVQDIDVTSIKVYKMNVDAEGKVSDTEGTLVSQGSNPDQYILDSGSNGNGFKINFNKAVTDPYKITYNAKYPQDFYTGGSQTLTNSVTAAGKTISATHEIGQGILRKSHELDVNAQELTWRITITADNKEITNLTLTDAFAKANSETGMGKQTLIGGTDGIAIDGVKAGTSPSITIVGNEPTTEGFTITGINIAKGSTATITYKTEYDIVSDGKVSTKYENTATANWDTAPGFSVSVSDDYEPKSTTTNNGRKTGTYDYSTQTFTWGVIVNFNKQNINGATIKDTPGVGHDIVEGSLEIYDFIPTGNDSSFPTYTYAQLQPFKGSVSLTNPEHYTVTYTELEGKKIGFELTFNSNLGVKNNKVYYVEYQTKDSDHIVGLNVTEQSEPSLRGTYTNTATFKTSESTTHTLTSTPVAVANANHLISKSVQGNISSNTTGILNWTIDVNKSLSDIGVVTLTDQPSSNLMLLPDSIEIRTMTSVGVTGAISYGDWVKVSESDVTIDLEEGSFTLALGNLSVPTRKAVQVRYKTYVLGPTSGNQFSNKATIHYNNAVVEEDVVDSKHNTKWSFAFSFSDATSSSTKGSIKLQKFGVDQTTGNEIPLAGVNFQLIKKIAGNEYIIQEGSTKADGTLTFENVRYGTYFIKEVAAPDGHIKMLDEEFILSGGNDILVLENKDKIIKLQNIKINQGIKLTKIAAEDHNKPLAGAVFKLYKSDDTLVTEDKNRNPITQGQLTTNNEGIIIIDDLPVGNYYLEETIAPDGYWLDSTHINFTVSASNVEIIERTMQNTKQGNIIIKKVDEFGVPLGGAVFTLSNGTDTYTSKKDASEEGTLIFENVKYGTYQLEETTTPNGYVGLSGTIPIVVDDTTNIIETPDAVASTITNEKIHQAVKLVKVDDATGEGLAGVVFTLHHVNDNSQVTTDENNEPLGILATKSTGELVVNNLPPGQYYFKEVTPPQYYPLPQGDAAKSVNFTIAPGQTTQTNAGTMTNIRGEGSIVIKKADALSKIALSGVNFTLYNSDKTVVRSGTTDANGAITFNNLPYDTYTLEEVAPKDGYMAANSTKEIVLNSDTNNRTVEEDVENQPLRTLRIRKVDARDKTKVLEGAEFEITKPGGEAVEATTDKDGLIELKELEFGTYTIEEIKAPSGYRLNTDVETVTIDESSRSLVIEIEIENTRRSNGGGGGGGGTDPKEPEKPTIPGETPGKPEEPTKPVDPAVPTKPTEPTNPGETPEVPEKPVIKEETPKETPKEGEIPVPEESTSEVGTPPTNGTVTVDKDGKWKYTPNPGFTGKDGFTIKVVHPDGTEEEILIEIDVDEIPLGTTTPDGTEKLPQTGEETLLNNYLTGGLIALLGYTLLRKKKDSQEA